MEETFWAGRPVLITGATGFLGSHLTQALVDGGAVVTILRRPQGEVTPLARGWLGDVTVAEGDLLHPGVMADALARSGARTVFHLAAQTQVGIAQEAPLPTFQANVAGTWTCLDACHRAPAVEQVVMASTDKAYGPQATMPLTEDLPLLAADPYNASKACAELVARSYALASGLPVAMTRCANFYGPGDRNWRRIVPGTLRAILNGRAPELRSDGSQVRDYLYVGDGVSATLRLAEVLAEDPSLRGEAFNFSAELPLTAREMVMRLQERAGTAFEPVVLGTSVNELAEQRLSAAKARERLDWAPAFTMAEGLDATIAYYADLFTERPEPEPAPAS